MENVNYGVGGALDSSGCPAMKTCAKGSSKASGIILRVICLLTINLYRRVYAEGTLMSRPVEFYEEESSGTVVCI